MTKDLVRPHVSFEIRAMEDRSATILLGGYRTKDVDFAIFRMPGDKNTVLEKEITPGEIARWRDTTLPHLNHLPAAYDAWKDGQEEPTNGIPLEQWPNISPSQIQQAKALNIRTVEDFANLSEQGLQEYGIGGQTLKNKAKAYLDAASGSGKVAETMAAMQAQIKEMQDQLTAEQKRSSEKDAVISTLIPEKKDTLKLKRGEAA
jgi:hypothetical protein